MQRLDIDATSLLSRRLAQCPALIGQPSPAPLPRILEIFMRSLRSLARPRPLLLLSSAALALVLVAWALPQDKPRGRSGVVMPAAEQPVELMDHMDGLKKNLKALATGMSEGKPAAELLVHVTGMQEHALKAKSFVPPNLSEVPEKRREAHRNAFRADMLRLLIDLANLEIDLLEGRPEEAFGRVTGSLFKLREASHEKYQKP